MKLFSLVLLLFGLTLNPDFIWTNVFAQTPAQSQATSDEEPVFAFKAKAGKTVLEQLKVKARVRTQTSQLGELVVEINGVVAGNGRYFIYRVNGEKVKNGAGSYITKKGDRIEWKLTRPRKAEQGNTEKRGHEEEKSK